MEVVLGPGLGALRAEHGQRRGAHPHEVAAHVAGDHGHLRRGRALRLRRLVPHRLPARRQLRLQALRAVRAGKRVALHGPDGGRGAPGRARRIRPACQAAPGDPRLRRRQRAANSCQRVGLRDFDLHRYGLEARADYRFADDGTAVFTYGRTSATGIELTGLGAGQTRRLDLRLLPGPHDEGPLLRADLPEHQRRRRHLPAPRRRAAGRQVPALRRAGPARLRSRRRPAGLHVRCGLLPHRPPHRGHDQRLLRERATRWTSGASTCSPRRRCRPRSTSWPPAAMDSHSRARPQRVLAAGGAGVQAHGGSEPAVHLQPRLLDSLVAELLPRHLRRRRALAARRARLPDPGVRNREGRLLLPERRRQLKGMRSPFNPGGARPAAPGHHGRDFWPARRRGRCARSPPRAGTPLPASLVQLLLARCPPTASDIGVDGPRPEHTSNVTPLLQRRVSRRFRGSGRATPRRTRSGGRGSCRTA